MKRKKIYQFEFPSNLGLKKKPEVMEPGVKLLPDWLRKHNFHQQIGPEKIITLAAPDYAMDLDVETGVRNADKIIAYAKAQAASISPYLDRHAFCIFIGGDCSILIGCALALKQSGRYGLFFLDGHTDYVPPDISRSKAAAAMELAIVTGYGHEKLSNIFKLGPYFDESAVWCVGNREYDPKVVREITASNIQYVDLKMLRKLGPEHCASQFLEMVGDNRLEGFLVHLDADVLNDDIMPVVDTREKDGLTYEELNAMLKVLLRHERAMGLEITILDPTLDQDGKYTKEFVGNFMEVFAKARMEE